MHRIMHRVNTIEQLLNTPVDLGVEVDIRSQGKELIIPVPYTHLRAHET